MRDILGREVNIDDYVAMPAHSEQSIVNDLAIYRVMTRGKISHALRNIATGKLRTFYDDSGDKCVLLDKDYVMLSMLEK